MPARKLLLVAGACAAGCALLVAAGFALVAGRTVLGIAVILATLAAASLALQAYWVAWDPSGRSLRAGRRDRKQVALTFDDGPGPDTPAILDALDAAGVRATFFVLGKAAEARPDLVRATAARGHVVALHGHTHRKLHLSVPGKVAREIDAGREAVRAAGVEPAPFFRAPHGFKGPVLGRALKQRGLTLVGWTRGVWDTERPGSDAIVERATSAMRGGEILLLHDGCATPGIDPRRDQTAAAVPGIVERWRAAGYEFITIDQLERVAGPRWAARARRWVGFAVVVGLGVLAARHIDPARLQRAFADADPRLLLAAAVANVVALAMQSGRWFAIVQPIQPRARAIDAFFTLVAGYAIGLVVPARASDLARAHLMSRRSGVSMATLTASVVVDHLLGTVALVAALGLLTAVSPVPGFVRTGGTIALVIAVAALAGLWLLRPDSGGTRDIDVGAAKPAPSRFTHPAAQRGANTPPAVPEDSRGRRAGEAVATALRERRMATWRAAVRALLLRLREGLLALRHPRALALSFGFALAGWAAEVAIAHLSLRAFGINAGIVPSLLAVIATTLSAAASVSPGNAGAFELACAVALSGIGIARESALAFAIGYHAVHLVPVAIIGAAWLMAHGYRAGAVREAP